MNWTKMIIMTILFSIMMGALICSYSSVLLMILALLFVGISWSYLNRLNWGSGLKEGFFLGSVSTLIVYIVTSIMGTAGNIGIVALLGLLIFFGLISSVASGICGVINQIRANNLKFDLYPWKN